MGALHSLTAKLWRDCSWPGRSNKKFQNELPNEQAGFRRGRRTADMLCCIQNVIEKTLLMSERTFIVVIDCSKTFDSFSHIHMFNILNDTSCCVYSLTRVDLDSHKQSEG